MRKARGELSCFGFLAVTKDGNLRVGGSRLFLNSLEQANFGENLTKSADWRNPAVQFSSHVFLAFFQRKS